MKVLLLFYDPLLGQKAVQHLKPAGPDFVSNGLVVGCTCCSAATLRGKYLDQEPDGTVSCKLNKMIKENAKIESPC
jgi:hypothetical protein